MASLFAILDVSLEVSLRVILITLVCYGKGQINTYVCPSSLKSNCRINVLFS